MNFFKYTALLSFLLCIGCTPDPLEGFEKDVGTKADTTVPKDDTGGGDGGGGNVASAEFIVIADMFRAKCALSVCHGMSATNGLKVVQSEQATDKEVFDAMLTETLSTDGDPFIVAGNSAGSNYLARMEQEPGATFMPIGGTKDQAEVDQVKAWIDGGAKFN